MRPPRVRHRPKSRTVSAARLAVTLFALFAFTLQSFVAQVHMHGAPASVAAHAPAKQQPAGNDQTTCPICQLIAHAGHVITPSVSVWAPLAIAVFAVAVTRDIAPAAETFSHGWQSRAPPKA